MAKIVSSQVISDSAGVSALGGMVLSEVQQVPAAPVNTIAPSVSGGSDVGDVLTVSVGSWTGYPLISYAFQWRRAGVNISGATSQSYTLVSADDGNNVDCVVTGTNTEGNASATSNATAVVDVSAPVNTVAPSIGSAQINVAATVTTGTWSGVPTPTYAYQWQIDTGAGFADIPGETSSSYTPLAADLGDSVRCVVTATNSQGSATANSDTVVVAEATSLAEIFSKRTTGGYWDVQDLTSMRQNSDGTVRAEVGSPVGLLMDKSGNANHLTQATSAARPTLRQDGSGHYYLEFDGVDDFLQTPQQGTINDEHFFGFSFNIDPTDTVGMFVSHPSLTIFFSMYQDGSTGGSAAAQTYIDNVLTYTSATRDEMFNAVDDGLVSLITTNTPSNNYPYSFMHGPGYGGLYACKGDVYRIALATELSASERATFNAWLGERVVVEETDSTPAPLFLAGDDGGYYDIQQLNNMKQNSDGTVDAVVGSPVGWIRDSSGNNNPLIQSVASRRPTLRQEAGGDYYLEFDGVDDSMFFSVGTYGDSGNDAAVAFSMKTSDADGALVGDGNIFAFYGYWDSASTARPAQSDQWELFNDAASVLKRDATLDPRRNDLHAQIATGVYEPFIYNIEGAGSHPAAGANTSILLMNQGSWGLGTRYVEADVKAIFFRNAKVQSATERRTLNTWLRKQMGQQAQTFSLASLFSSSQEGAYFNFQDISTMKQNSDGTVDAVVGSPVGYIEDQSPNNYHMTQSIASQRPTLRQNTAGKYYLEFDGVDDKMLVMSAAMMSSVVVDTGMEFSLIAEPVGTGRYISVSHLTSTPGGYWGVVEDGSTAALFFGAYKNYTGQVNGNDVTTRDEAYDGVHAGRVPQIHRVESSHATNNQADHTLGRNYFGSWVYDEDTYGFMWRLGSALSPAEREIVNGYLMQQAGV